MKVAEGEIAGFLGPNGSGKTTTIRVMCGLLTPTRARAPCSAIDVRTDGQRIKREVGYMTQRFSFYEDLSIEENLTFVARLYDLDPARSYVRDTLEDLGMTRAHQLAGTACPAAGSSAWRLPPASCTSRNCCCSTSRRPASTRRRAASSGTRSTRAAGGLTVLVSTHYMDEAERCHRIHYISYGKVLASGTVAGGHPRCALTTFVLEGGDTPKAAKMLQGMPGVDQIAPFGNELHVVGSDKAKRWPHRSPAWPNKPA
jgi:ABC-2 type transport system ATP-binding protein